MNRSLIQKPEKFRFNTILIDEPMIGNQYLTYDGITVLINGISDKYEAQFGTFYKIVMFNKHTHTSEMLAHYHNGRLASVSYLSIYPNGDVAIQITVPICIKEIKKCSKK